MMNIRFFWRNVATIVACLAVTTMFWGCKEDDPVTYTLKVTVEPEGSGTVAFSPQKDAYEEGTTVTLTATAKTGYTFDGWYSGTTNVFDQPAGFEVKMDANKTYTAKFVEEQTGTAQTGLTYVSTTPDGEKVYTLKVTQTVIKSTATDGDTYVLLYVDKSGEVKTSTGVVTSSEGNSLVLTPASGAAFTVTLTPDGITNISGTITFDDKTTAAGGTLTPFTDGEIEITGTAIEEDRVLGVPGMAINYVYNGTGLLAVNAGKTLTVLPGTAIRFTQTGSGLEIKSEATLKMLGIDKLFPLDAEGKISTTPGTASGHVTLKGSGSGDNKWRGLVIASTLANELNHVDIVNAGSRNENDAALYLANGKVAMRNCVIDGSKSNGIILVDASASKGNTVHLTEFTGNTVKNSAKAPIYTADDYAGIYPFRSLGTGNIFSGNANEYIHISDDMNAEIHSDMTLPNAGIPWYFENGLSLENNIKLTIEKGNTILMGTGNYSYISVPATSHLIVEGTAQERITIKGLNDEAGYWRFIRIYSQSPGTKFNYCDISGGGGGSEYYKTLLYVYTGSYDANNNPAKAYIELNNTTFSKSLNYGIFFDYYNNSNECNISTDNAATVTFGTGANQCVAGNIVRYVSPIITGTYTSLAEYLDAFGGSGNGDETKAPGAVMNFTATSGDKQVSLSWNAPSDNGGAEITGYEVTMDNWATKVTKTASERSHTFPDLTNGTQYTFKVRAVNSEGAGEESTQTATPAAPEDGQLDQNLILPEGQAWVQNDISISGYIFKSDGTYAYHWGDWSNTSTGTWSTKGSTLTLTQQGIDPRNYTYVISGNNLTITNAFGDADTYIKSPIPSGN